MKKNHVALVTGVSSGIGWATAELLAQHGFCMFGTMRRPGENSPSGVEILPLDVRDDASVRSCVNRVLATAGRVDLLVNNAGVALYGALEEVSMEQAGAVFETNFFGVLRMTQAVLPTMREQGRGRIVNIGSVAGFIPIPFEGIYSASKHALDGYSDALGLEVRRFGIHVSIIQPSFLRSNIDRNTAMADRLIAAYEDQRQRAIEALRRSSRRPTRPQWGGSSSAQRSQEPEAAAASCRPQCADPSQPAHTPAALLVRAGPAAPVQTRLNSGPSRPVISSPVSRRITRAGTISAQPRVQSWVGWAAGSRSPASARTGCSAIAVATVVEVYYHGADDAWEDGDGDTSMGARGDVGRDCCKGAGVGWSPRAADRAGRAGCRALPGGAAGRTPFHGRIAPEVRGNVGRG